MRHSSSSRHAIAHSAQLKRCRAVVDRELFRAIETATRKGWKPAEVAMALADAADDLIFTLASQRQGSLVDPGTLPVHIDGAAI